MYPNKNLQVVDIKTNWISFVSFIMLKQDVCTMSARYNNSNVTIILLHNARLIFCSSDLHLRAIPEYMCKDGG